MDNRRKHTKRVFAMLLALIMCLSQAVTAAADEVSDNKAVPETVSEESAPGQPQEAEEGTQEEGPVPEEPSSGAEEAVSEEAVPGEPEEAAGDGELVSGNFIYKVVGDEVTILGLSDESTVNNLVIPASINGLPVTVIGDNAFYFSGDSITGNLTILTVWKRSAMAHLRNVQVSPVVLLSLTVW